MLAQPKKGGTQKGFAYHEEDNYYQVGQEQGCFYGQLASDLGYAQLEREALFNALEGNNAQGVRMVKTREDGVDENGYRKNAYTDLTFSADKSISVAYGQALKHDITLAYKLSSSHQQAVRKVLDFIEKEYTYSRTDTKAQDKALFLLYDHFDARMANGQLDPSLHTHALMVNITQNENGTYNKLENRHIAKDHKMLGMLYRNELAHILQSQGLEIEVYDAKQGFFQLKGFQKEQREEFSQRTQVINEWIQNNEERIKAEYPNITAKKLRDIAQQETRGWKDKSIDKMQYMVQNQERAEKVNYLLPTHDHVFSSQIDATTIVNMAVQDLLDHKSVLSKKDILDQAAKISLGAVSNDDLLTAFSQHTDLMQLKDGQFSTQEIIDKEQFIFSQANKPNFIVTQSQNQIDIAIKKFEIKKGFKLKSAQNSLVHAILSSDSKYIIAQGVAGSGKSTSFEIVRNVCADQNIKIVALAPTGTATDNLSQEANIKDNFTVAKFIQTQDEGIKNAVVIVDEAGMLGTRDTYELMRIAQENNLKLVFSGDKNQKKSISQGDIFAEIQTKGFTTINLDEGNRQKNDLMCTAVKQILKHDITAALNTLQNTTKQIQSYEERLAYAQELYMQDRENSLLITTTNADRISLNKSIRAKLTEEGHITDSKSFTTREPLNLSALEKRQASSYSIGDNIYLSKNIGSITAGKEAVITAMNQENNTITIKHQGKQKAYIEVVNLLKDGTKLNLFKTEQRDFGIADQIIFKKNDKKLGLANGQIGTITHLSGNLITVKINDKKITFNTKEYNYIQHAYAITDFASQGKTTNRVIAVANSNTASFNDFYTQITRAKYEAHIITDNLEQLKIRAAQDSIKLNAMQMLNYTLKQTKREVQNHGKRITGAVRGIFRSAIKKLAHFTRNLNNPQRGESRIRKEGKTMKNPKELLVNLTKDVQLKINPKELMDIVSLCKACIKHEVTFSSVIGKIASKLELPQAHMFKIMADSVSTAINEILKNDTTKKLGIEQIHINDLLKNVEKMKNSGKEILLVNLTKDVHLTLNPKELMDIVALYKECIKHEVTFSSVIGKIASKLELPQAEMFKSTADLVSTAVKSGVEVQKNDTIKTLGERVQSVVSLAQTATSKI